MAKKRKPSRYWTKERCREEALKYNLRADFKRGSRGAYDAVYRNEWQDELCGHMSKYKPFYIPPREYFNRL